MTRAVVWRGSCMSLSEPRIIRLVAFSLIISTISWAGQNQGQDRNQREMVEALEAYAVFKMGRHEEAFEAWLALAQKGNTQGMLNVGNMYQTGQGVEQDSAKARYWYQQGAAQGDSNAWLALAQLAESGDSKTAIRLYQRAAQAGSTEAQRHVAQHLLAHNQTQAACIWLQRATDQDDDEARVLLRRHCPKLTQTTAATGRNHLVGLAGW